AVAAAWAAVVGVGGSVGLTGTVAAPVDTAGRVATVVNSGCGGWTCGWLVPTGAGTGGAPVPLAALVGVAMGVRGGPAALPVAAEPVLPVAGGCELAVIEGRAATAACRPGPWADCPLPVLEVGAFCAAPAGGAAATGFEAGCDFDPVLPD